MRTSRDRPTPARGDIYTWTETVLLDELIDGYIDWSESAEAVADAYARWSRAPAPERALRFAAYLATLDQEEHTALAYAEAVAVVERWLRRSA